MYCTYYSTRLITVLFCTSFMKSFKFPVGSFNPKSQQDWPVPSKLLSTRQRHASKLLVLRIKECQAPGRSSGNNFRCHTSQKMVNNFNIFWMILIRIFWYRFMSIHIISSMIRVHDASLSKARTMGRKRARCWTLQTSCFHYTILEACV